MHSFSIIIIYREASTDLDRCLESISTSIRCLNPAPPFHEVLTSSRPNRCISRNELSEKAKGEILVFLDADALASDFWLHELLKPFQDPEIAVVGGSHIIKQDASLMESLADKILAFPLATWKSAARYGVKGKIRETDESELTSCNLAIRKKAFVEAGGFPADFFPCEENVLMNRIESLGYKMIYNPLAIVFHARDPLFMPHARKIFFYATGRGKMIRQGRGGIRFIPKPSREILYLGLGLCLHYTAYLSGLLYGIIRGHRYD